MHSVSMEYRTGDLNACLAYKLCADISRFTGQRFVLLDKNGASLLNA